MAKECTARDVHRCQCAVCREHPRGKLAAEHRAINRLVAVSDERVRRLLVGFLAKQFGRGGISRLARITGLDRKTIATGQRQLREQTDSDAPGASSVSPRVRRPGAGRKRVEIQHPGS